MTNEEKQLLLQDLCMRLPYGVKVKIRSNDVRTVRGVDIIEGVVHFVESDTISPFGMYVEHPTSFRQAVKPFLRPMSSMTEEEKDELYTAIDWYGKIDEYGNIYTGGQDKVWRETFYEYVDFLNTHHFDFRGLIEKGLALEAPEKMYN